MLPTFLKEAEKQRIHLKRIRKTHTKFARKQMQLKLNRKNNKTN